MAHRHREKDPDALTGCADDQQFVGVTKEQIDKAVEEQSVYAQQSHSCGGLLTICMLRSNIKSDLTDLVVICMACKTSWVIKGLPRVVKPPDWEDVT